MCSQITRLDLFGGEKSWDSSEWTSSDDRVRGGASQSYLKCNPSDSIANFEGKLDIKALGGAGFASQRTTGEHRQWDLSNFDGVVLDIAKSDGKQYTIILKDELLPKSPNGREQSTISWEYDFTVDKDIGKDAVFVKWNDFKATYRGREKKGAEPLNLTDIKRISLMMRSFFGTQEGDFSLSVVSITAFQGDPKSGVLAQPSRNDPEGKSVPRHLSEKSDKASSKSQQGWLGGLLRS